MKNLMEMYLNFTEKRIKKYMRIIYSQYYNEEIVAEYLKTYVNARYYNIRNTEKPARAFYLRIIDELNFKKEILIKRNDEIDDREEKAQNLKMINNVDEVFEYILFFDNVRKIENFKKIDSLREIIKKITEKVASEFDIKVSKEDQEKLYKEVTSDLIEKDVFLDKFETDEFYIMVENCEQKEDLFFATLGHNVKMPVQYSDTAVEKVFSEGLVAEDKLQVEYMLLSLISLRDIIDGNFNDTYVAEFATTLFKKKAKLDSILSIIGHQALQDKIYLNIDYSDYIKNQKLILEYTNKGFNFAITLDNKIRSVEDVEELKMFKIVIAQKNLVLYRELKQKQAILNNVIFK